LAGLLETLGELEADVHLKSSLSRRLVLMSLRTSWCDIVLEGGRRKEEGRKEGRKEGRDS